MNESEKPFPKEIDYHRYWKKEYEKEHKLRQEAENEMVLIKGITVTNSPELREAKKEIENLKADLARAKEDHQFDNLVHKREMEDLRQKLDPVNRMRKDGVI